MYVCMYIMYVVCIYPTGDSGRLLGGDLALLKSIDSAIETITSVETV